MQPSSSSNDSSSVSAESVQITVEERLNVEISRDGAVRTSELTGAVLILIKDEALCKVKFSVECLDAENVQIQVRVLNIFGFTLFNLFLLFFCRAIRTSTRSSSASKGSSPFGRRLFHSTRA